MVNLIIGIIVGLTVGILTAFFVMRKVALKKIDRHLTDIVSSKESVREFLLHHFAEQEMDEFIRRLKSHLSNMIYARISDQSVSDNISRLVIQSITDKLSVKKENDTMSNHSFFGSAVNAVKDAIKSHTETIIVNHQTVIEQTLSHKINEVIKSNGKELVSSLIDKEIEKILSMPMSTLFEGNEKSVLALKQRIVRGFNV